MRRAATSIVLIVIVAFVARAAFAWSQTAKVPRDAAWIVPFQTETGHIAYSLATGKGFASPFQRDSGPTAWLTPVYPLLVAGIFKLFGVYTRASFLAAIFLNIVFSSATCVPIFYAGKRIAGIGAASGGAWLWALFPNAILIPFEWIWDTSLAALLAAILLWATLELAESQRWREWIGYGLLWGLTLMTNPAVGATLPVLLGWLAYREYRAGRVHLTRPALAVVVALLCCAPWSLRNFAVFHRFIPFRSNLSYELYIGNNENYDERRRGLPAIITQDMETLRYLRMGETAFMDEEKRKALQFMKANPRRVMQLMQWRFVDFWMGVADPWRTFAETDSWLIRGILLGNFVSAVGALAGILVLFWRRSAYALPLAAFPVCFPILYYVTHTSLRYRHPIDPVVLLLLAVGIGAIGRVLEEKRSVKKTALGIAVLIVFALLSGVPAAAQDVASPENSSRELQIWTGGGGAINGGAQGTGVWNLGLRYGLILTAPHGPGILNGQLEYAFDVVPVWVIAQKTNTAYGGSVDPFAFKWIFDKPKKVKPYFQIEGGALFTNTKVPEGASQINFTTSGGIGAHFLGKKHNFSVEVRFQHISDASMTNYNPGINTMQLRIGFGEFRN